MDVQTPKVNFSMKTFFCERSSHYSTQELGLATEIRLEGSNPSLCVTKVVHYCSRVDSVTSQQVLSSILDGLKHPAPFLIHQCSLTFLPKKLQAPGQNPTQNSAILLFQATPRSLGIKHEIYYLATQQRFSDTSNHQATLLPFLLLHWHSWPCTWKCS